MPKISMQVSDDVCSEIARFARRHKVSESEAMRWVLSILKVANSEAAKGHSLGLIEDRGGKSVVVSRIVGI